MRVKCPAANQNRELSERSYFSLSRTQRIYFRIPFIQRACLDKQVLPFNLLSCSFLISFPPLSICTFLHKRASSPPCLPLSFSLQGNVTFHCSESQPLSVTFRSLGSFLTVPADLGTESFSTRLQIRTWNHEGLIVTAQLAWEPRQQLHLRLILQLQGGRAFLSLDSLSDPPTHLYSGETETPGNYGHYRG